MTEDEWRKRYAARIQAVTLCTPEFAEDCAKNTSLGTFLTVEDDPEGAADDEMGEWTDDGDDGAELGYN